jgi:6-phosphogluconate dehydrogenase
LKREIGIVGLGKMGGNLARRLVEKGWLVVGWNRTATVTQALEKEGLRGAYSFKEFVQKLTPPRVIWIELPAGAVVEEALKELTPLLSAGDIVVDGGNSYFKDALRRAKTLAKKKIEFVDVGVSGGPGGARHGASLMIGGKRETFAKLEPLFYDLARENGYQFFAGYGAGHFVKMVHNGIEYGMMQALAEGFAILKKSKYKLDLTRVADIYNHGSVIESRLVGWLEKAFELHGEDLGDVSGSVKHTGEGAWTVKTVKEMKLKAKIIEGALQFRIQSEKNPSYTGKILSALRGQFGGHEVKHEK